MSQDTRERPAPPQPPQPPQIIITMAPNGAVQVTGPIDNKILCYGLLDCARDAIKDYNDQRAKPNSTILPARPVDPFLLRQNGQGGRTS